MSHGPGKLNRRYIVGIARSHNLRHVKSLVRRGQSAGRENVLVKITHACERSALLSVVRVKRDHRYSLLPSLIKSLISASMAF